MSESAENAYDTHVSKIRSEYSNFRDVGGLPARDGRTFASGVVFRTQALVDPAPEVVQALMALGLSTVVDLRMNHERVELPIDLPESVEVVIANVASDFAKRNGITEAGAAAAPRPLDKNAYVPSANLSGGYNMMVNLYRGLVTFESAKIGYAQMLRSIINSEGSVAIFCAAGKDRTGWGSALLQSFAGVDDHVIIDSYLETNKNLSDRYASAIEDVKNSGGDLEAFMAVVSSNGDYLVEGFATLRSAYGDTSRYFAEGLGLTDNELKQLQSRILTS
jgi:protein-tyrosine phosphatase